MAILRNRDIGGAPSDTRFGEHRRNDDQVTLTSSDADQTLATAIEHLLTYEAEHGDTDVPSDYVSPDGYNLGAWVVKTRQRFRAARTGGVITGRIQPGQQEILERAVPTWKWETDVEENYNRHIELLEQFAAEHGHTRVPQFYVTPDGTNLGVWVARRRKTYAANNEGPWPLSLEHRARLEALPGWVWNAKEDQFERSLAHLQKYVAKHRELPKKTYVTADGLRLGRWVADQRAAAKAPPEARRKMTEERKRRLEAVPGWTWDATRTAAPNRAANS